MKVWVVVAWAASDWAAEAAGGAADLAEEAAESVAAGRAVVAWVAEEQVAALDLRSHL